MHPVSRVRLTGAAAAAVLAIGWTVSVTSAHAATRDVRTAAELQSALSAVQPGDTIRLADAVYAGKFTASRSGTASAPITLQGSRNAIIDGGGTGNGRAFQLSGSFWRLQGFTIRNGQKGLMALGVRNVVVDGLAVFNIGDEAIHFRDNSTDNVVQNSEIHDTGKREPGFGEGVYLGQAVSNWVNGQPDRSDRNKVLNNRIGPNIAAEHIDVKEGTTGGEIRGNRFDGHGQTGANSGESWINAKGDNYTIADNVGNAAFKSGYKTRTQVSGTGCGNVFRHNSGSATPSQVAGWGFDIGNNSGCTSHPNEVCDDNTATGANGVSNIPLTRC